jgi:hypothetical protein
MAIVSFEKYRFELTDPDLHDLDGNTNIYNIYKQFKWVLGFLTRSGCRGQFPVAVSSRI